MEGLQRNVREERCYPNVHGGPPTLILSTSQDSSVTGLSKNCLTKTRKLWDFQPGFTILRSNHPTKKKENGESFERVVALDSYTFYKNFGVDRFIVLKTLELRAKKLCADWNRECGPAKMQNARVTRVAQFALGKHRWQGRTPGYSSGVQEESTVPLLQLTTWNFTNANQTTPGPVRIKLEDLEVKLKYWSTVYGRFKADKSGSCDSEVVTYESIVSSTIVPREIPESKDFDSWGYAQAFPDFIRMMSSAPFADALRDARAVLAARKWPCDPPISSDASQDTDSSSKATTAVKRSKKSTAQKDPEGHETSRVEKSADGSTTAAAAVAVDEEPCKKKLLTKKKKKKKKKTPTSTVVAPEPAAAAAAAEAEASKSEGDNKKKQKLKPKLKQPPPPDDLFEAEDPRDASSFGASVSLLEETGVLQKQEREAAELNSRREEEEQAPTESEGEEDESEEEQGEEEEDEEGSEISEGEGSGVSAEEDEEDEEEDEDDNDGGDDDDRRSPSILAPTVTSSAASLSALAAAEKRKIGSAGTPLKRQASVVDRGGSVQQEEEEEEQVVFTVTGSEDEPEEATDQLSKDEVQAIGAQKRKKKSLKRISLLRKRAAPGEPDVRALPPRAKIPRAAATKKK